MGEYEIFFKQSVYKELKTIPKNDLNKILSRIKNLSINPRPVGCEKLIDKEFYGIRQGKYSIVYSIQDNELTVWIIKVGHRKNIYR